MDAEKYVQSRLELIRRNSTYGLNLEKHADWLDYKKKISAILNDEPLETRYNPIVEVQVMEEEWRKIQKEAEFHCGVEESGGHAYNCNDCPNKCEEWSQWDKEFKEAKNDKKEKFKEVFGLEMDDTSDCGFFKCTDRPTCEGCPVKDTKDWWNVEYKEPTTHSLDVAIDTMRKYQKIEEIVNNYISSGKPYISVIDEDIKEVLEDGNVD